MRILVSGGLEEGSTLTDRYTDGVGAMQRIGSTYRVILYKERTPLDGGAVVNEAMESYIINRDNLLRSAWVVLDALGEAAYDKVVSVACRVSKLLH